MSKKKAEQSHIDTISGKGIINSFSDPLLLLNNRFKVTMANDAILSFLMAEEEHLLKRDLTEIVYGIFKDDPQWKEIITKSSDGMVREAVLKWGEQSIDVMITISPLFKDNKPVGFILLFRDMRSVKELMESLKEAYRKMSEMVVTDSLTRLFNRGHFNDRVKDFYSDVNNGVIDHFTFIIFDIDHFKDINDNLGHQIGDEVIIAISSHAKDFFKQYKGEVFRYGGEEFVAMSAKVSPEETFQIADQFRNIVEEKIPFPQGITVTVSVGAITYTLENKAEINSVDVLIRRADAALYEAKEGGRNQVRMVALSSTELETVEEDFNVDLF